VSIIRYKVPKFRSFVLPIGAASTRSKRLQKGTTRFQFPELMSAVNLKNVATLTGMEHNFD
jgi:hypothetical protein